MLSCRELTERASEAVGGTLPPLARLKLRLHLMICDGCRAYIDQMRGLKTMLRHRPPSRQTAGAEAAVMAVLRVSDEETPRR
jgi:anti-sigma factor ChrR (cupin superfamily)